MALQGVCFALMPVSATVPAARRVFEDAPDRWLPTTGPQSQLLLGLDGQPVKSLRTLGPAHCGTSSLLRVLEVKPVDGSCRAPTLTGLLKLRVDPEVMLVLRCRYSYGPSARTDPEEALRALAYRAATRLLARIAAQLEHIAREDRRRSFAAHPSQDTSPPWI